MTRAVFFDMGGVLVFDRGFAHHLARNVRLTLREAGLEYSEEEVLRAWKESSVHGDELETWDLVRSMVLLRKLGVTPKPLLAEKVYKAVLESYVQGFSLDEEAEHALSLSRSLGFTVGLITNVGSYEIVRRRLEEAGLLKYVDVIVASQAVAWKKPSPRIFELACYLAGVEPGNAVHVGDDPRIDVEGAKKAGLRAVQVLKAGPPRSPYADAWVNSVGEVPGILEDWVSKGLFR